MIAKVASELWDLGFNPDRIKVEALLKGHSNDQIDQVVAEIRKFGASFHVRTSDAEEIGKIMEIAETERMSGMGLPESMADWYDNEIRAIHRAPPSRPNDYDDDSRELKRLGDFIAIIEACKV